jgi:hypothetical protein
MDFSGCNTPLTIPSRNRRENEHCVEARRRKGGDRAQRCGEIVEAAGTDEETRRIVSKNVEDGGGGGSRTRVRKHVPAGLYMRVRF